MPILFKSVANKKIRKEIITMILTKFKYELRSLVLNFIEI